MLRMKKAQVPLSMRLTTALSLIPFIVTDVWGQSGALPSRTQCKLWDDAFLSVFNWSLWGTLAGACVLSLFAGIVLGKLFWIFTAPRRRIFIITLICLGSVMLLIGFGPWLIGLGRLWFAGIDPRYFDCSTMQFGAEGFFGGLFGSGVPAIAQVPAVVIALCSAAILGGLLAWVLSEVLSRWALGIRAKIKGEAA